MTVSASDPRWQCHGKIHYLSRAGAIAGLSRLQRAQKGKARLVQYECPHCGGWHNGHRQTARARQRDRIRRLRGELDG